MFIYPHQFCVGLREGRKRAHLVSRHRPWDSRPLPARSRAGCRLRRPPEPERLAFVALADRILGVFDRDPFPLELMHAVFPCLGIKRDQQVIHGRFLVAAEFDGKSCRAARRESR